MNWGNMFFILLDVLYSNNRGRWPTGKDQTAHLLLKYWVKGYGLQLPVNELIIINIISDF